MSAALYAREDALRAKGCARVCGVDEAGRGPLAGPVVAAAVILPPGLHIDGLNDSKALSERRRTALFYEITAAALDWSVGFATVAEIEAQNILQATFLAMRRAVAGLCPPPDFALIDGNRDPALPAGIPTETVVGGDGRCACIAAASVLAKVTRDRAMRELDALYPGYGFAKHKGYATTAHYAAIFEKGVCAIHRQHFLRSLEQHRPKDG